MSDLAPRDLSRHPPALTPDYRSSRLRAPGLRLLEMPEGRDLEAPVFGHDRLGALDADLIGNYGDQEPIGERIAVHGRVIDQSGRPVAGALVEIWQANAGGRYRHRRDDYLAPLDPGFGGCGRTITGADGSYAFRTIRPGPYPWPNGPNDWRPAHIHFSLFGPSFAQRLITQLYFEGDPLIPLCPIVRTLPDDRAVEALTARLDMDRAVPFDMLAYRFDIVLRGPAQTPFETRREGL